MWVYGEPYLETQLPGQEAKSLWLNIDTLMVQLATVKGTRPSNNYFSFFFSWVLRPLEPEWFASMLQGKFGALELPNDSVNSPSPA